MKRIFVLFSFFMFANIQAINVVPQDFHLTKYDGVAIATDLEPDDVMALKLIFAEANRIYQNQPDKNYPIDLIIVGEGNTAIKRMRLEKMINEYFDLPKNVNINVVEGKATANNIFPYDGYELFKPAELSNVKFESIADEAVPALKDFVRKSDKPLIIQIKPCSELLEFSDDTKLAAKTSVIFYGGFNFRATVSEPEKLQAMLRQFSDRFLKVAIVENYGVLGDESAVFFAFSWTNPIANFIETSQDPFYEMFRQLTYNWNRYILESSIREAIEMTSNLPQHQELLKVLQQLSQKWDEDLFQKVIVLSNTAPPDLQRTIKLMEKVQPAVGLQFTFADIIVGLTVSEQQDVFTAKQVRIDISEWGFIVPVETPGSNTIYFNRVNYSAFADALLNKMGDSKVGEKRGVRGAIPSKQKY
jgi:hypothetical protein